MVALFYWSIVHDYLFGKHYRGKQSFNILPELHLTQWLEFWSCGPPNIYCGHWGWQRNFFFLNWRHHYRGNIWNLSFFLLSCVSGQSHEVWHHDCFPLAGPNMQQGFSCCLEYTEDHPKTRLIVLTVVFFKCTFLSVFRSLFAYILQIFLLSLFPFKFGTRPEN